MTDEPKFSQDESAAERRDRFFRERRLLLIVSLLLMAHLVFNLNVEGGEALGVHIKIDQAKDLWLIVWAVWFWTMISSLTQWNSLRPYASFPEDRYQARRFILLQQWARSQLSDAVHSSFSRQLPGRQLRTYILVNGPGYVWHEERRHIEADVALAWKSEPNDPNVILVDEEAAGPISWVRTAGEGIDRHSIRTLSGSLGIPENQAPEWIRRRAIAWTWLTTSYFLDYLAPTLLGFVPLLVLLCQLAWSALPAHHGAIASAPTNASASKPAVASAPRQ